MSAQYQYYLFSKSKTGEIDSYSRLRTQDRSRVTRVIEILPPEPREKNGELVLKPLSQHVRDVMATIRKASTTPEPFFVDFRTLIEDGDPTPAVDAAAVGMMTAKNSGLAALPAFGLTDIPLLDQTLLGFSPERAMLRVPVGRFLNDVPGRLLERASQLGFDPGAIVLAVDLGALDGLPDNYLALAKQAMRTIPCPAEWGGLVLCGSSFPSSLSQLEPFTVEHVPRDDFRLWLHVRDEDIPRQPEFGDYGVTGPGKIEYKPGRKVVPKIRYPRTEEWIVIKGRDPERVGPGQPHQLCEILLQSGLFEEDPTSEAALAIKACGTHQGKPGSNTDWIRRGTELHIRVTIRRIATLS